MNELALAAFAASNDMHAADREARSRRFARFESSFDADAYLRVLGERGLRWLARSDGAFPERLGAIHDPPPGLFFRGYAGAELLSRPAVAMVGARSCTDYGAHVARELARGIAAAGVVVVSGLARGIDGWAHRGALEAGGDTAAVLGCGIDRDYPRAHAQLAAQIAATGVIVSEYPPGVAPAPWRFPARNRIVAGLTLGTIVVEARERSEITSGLSHGTNALLRTGAVPVTCAGDVLEALGIDPAAKPEPEPPPPGAPRTVLAAIDGGARTADEITRATGLAADEVAAALVELELSALVSAAAGVYRR